MGKYERIINNSQPLRKLDELAKRSDIEDFIDKLAEHKGISVDKIDKVGKSKSFNADDGLVVSNFKVYEKEESTGLDDLDIDTVDSNNNVDKDNKNKSEGSNNGLDDLDIDTKNTSEDNNRDKSGNGLDDLDIDTVDSNNNVDKDNKNKSEDSNNGLDDLDIDTVDSNPSSDKNLDINGNSGDTVTVTKEKKQDNKTEEITGRELNVKRKITDNIVIVEEFDSKIDKLYTINVDGEYRNATVMYESIDGLYMFINPEPVKPENIDEYNTTDGDDVEETHKSFEKNVSLEPESESEKKKSAIAYATSFIPLVPAIVLYYKSRSAEGENLFSKKVALNILGLQVTYGILAIIFYLLIPTIVLYIGVIYILMILYGSYKAKNGKIFNPPLTLGNLI